MAKLVTYIRHNFGIHNSDFFGLQPHNESNKYIGFCYDGYGFKENYNDYPVDQKNKKGFKATHNRFKALNKTIGKIVWIEYSNDKVKGRFFIGETTGDEIINLPIKTDPGFFYGALKIGNIKEYNYSDYPVLLSSIPQQLATCQRNEKVSKIVETIYYNKILDEISLDMLHYKNQEQLCANFMLNIDYVRRFFDYHKIIQNPFHYSLRYLAFNLGGSMRDIDIGGKNHEDEWLFAQVSFSSNISKLERFFDTLVKRRGILFTQDICDRNYQKGPIIHINLQDLFYFMLDRNPKMIVDLLGLPSELVSSDLVKKIGIAA
jgi:hypothetical protein